jgi:aryl-alcohol dehydrogenase-like predicted oxidoreductase
MDQTETPATRRAFSEVLPPLILGTATFNIQYVADPARMPYAEIISQALKHGVNAFDTSPYYGPSEILLGDALAKVTPPPVRESYFLITKAGRIASDEFDYSPRWIRYSVFRSLERLRTRYLDLVYTHDVEFVTPAEVVGAVRELRRLRDAGVVRHVGISGYPVSTLCSLAELVLCETGEPLDAVLSYSHFCLQNSVLGREETLGRFEAAHVGVVLNASMLSMGLLTTRGADRGPMASWHPAPRELQVACRSLADLAAQAGRTLEEVAIRWALLNWARTGAQLGSTVTNRPGLPRVGVSVMGVSTPAELEETWQVWNSVLDQVHAELSSDHDAAEVDDTNELVESKMWPALGSWRDFSWESPPADFNNLRSKPGQVPDDNISWKYDIGHG